MTSVMMSVAAYTADTGHVRNYFVFNIIIFGSRHGIIETAGLTCRESVTITLKRIHVAIFVGAVQSVVAKQFFASYFS